ncbi:MAG: hypothetical protein GY711_08215 [bacterium]|nr:hypothetical protein [bacterium]
MIASALLSTLALTTAATASQEPELLPSAPDGWRFEHLAFPLDFAPDIALQGFEELRFAPGMFDAEADDYFTYAFAIRAESDEAVDALWVEDFLDRYYLGLCKAVAGSKGVQIDPAQIDATVAAAGDGWTARIRIIEPFVTMKPLTLELDLEVRHGARTTDILGLASPQPREAGVWKPLRSIAKSWKEGIAMPVFFNHLYVVPDAETYAALAGSSFLRETFAASEERTTVRRDMSYTGVYFYGDQTYFEFLPPQESGELVIGASAVAFGFEDSGATDAFAAKLKEGEVQTFVGPITREVDGEHVPWFQIMGVQKAHAESRFSMFSLEYHPEFLSRWHAASSRELSGIGRRNVLARYAAKLEQAERRASAPLVDVTRVDLALDDRERERFLQVCRAFGYSIEEKAGTWICDGPGYEIVVSTTETPGGITAFQMSLRAPIEREPLHLGRAKLSFEGKTATLAFER